MLGQPIGLHSDHRVKVNSHFANQHKGDIPFGRVRGSLVGVYKATERYFAPDINVAQFGEARFKRVMALMYKIYAPYKGTCGLHPIGDTFVNPKSSLGYVCKQEMKRQYLLGHTKTRIRHKGELYALTPRLIEWMFENAHIYKIPVLWETSGKEEILKMLKVINGSIRTFTFGDPYYALCYATLLSGVKTFMKMMANQFGHSTSRMGVSFVRGSFTEMCEMLRDKIVVKGDCIKWDSNYTEVLAMASYYLCCYLIGIEPGDHIGSQLFYYVVQAHKSFVRMPLGQILEILKKVSGDPWTTGGNCQGHEFILLDHLIECADHLQMDPYRLYRQCCWNIYADDHLNGYPSFMRQFVTYEWRSQAYARCGQKLHAPPEDEVQDGPLGLSFLGAEVVEKHGYYVPRYSYERLLAILYCNDYSPEELESVIVSIVPLVSTNEKACDVLKTYLSTYFPHLLGYLTDVVHQFSGEEDGIKIIEKPQCIMNHSSNNPSTLGAIQLTVAKAPKQKKQTQPKKKKATVGKRKQPGANTTSRGGGPLSMNPRPAMRPSMLRTLIERRLMEYMSCEGMTIPKKAEYLAAILAPREAENIRLPDPWTREATATYQTKFVQNIMGVQGTAQNAANDVGRWSFILNPVIDNQAQVFSPTSTNWMFALQDGQNNTALWSNYWVAGVGGTNFINYFQDINQATFVGGTNPIMAKCRPICACILATSVAPPITVAGNIAAAWVPGDWWVMAGANSTLANSTKWETIATYKGAYDGPTNEGSYIIWVPEDESDTLLYDTLATTTTNMRTHMYPMLCMSGQVATGAGQPSGVAAPILRLDCYINWEYTTYQRITACAHGSKDINERYLAYKLLADCAIAMPNDQHINWIRAVLGGVLGFVVGGPVGSAVGFAAGAGISLSNALGRT
jgi:hypothetical protein